MAACASSRANARRRGPRDALRPVFCGFLRFRCRRPGTAVRQPPAASGRPVAASSKRRLVVHVGTPKTGTTTIQHALVALEPHLRQLGVHVPIAGRTRLRSAYHAKLAHAPNSGALNPKKGPWGQLLDEIRASEARQFVISCEGFSANNGRKLPKIIAEVAKCGVLDVDIVACVRPQCQYIESRYAQRVKKGYTHHAFDRFVAVTMMSQFAPHRFWLDYNRVFAPWREVFGDSVTILPMDSAHPPDALLERFLRLLGAGDLALDPQPSLNARLGAKEMEVRRLTAAALTGRVPPRRLQPMMARLRELPGLLEPDAPFAGFSRAQALELMERLEPENAAFARNYGVDAEGNLFRGPVVDGLARPNVAQWHDLEPGEQRSVRDYVQRTVGVDPTPRVRPRVALSRGATAPLGSMRWLANWVTDPRFLWGAGANLALWLVRTVMRPGRSVHGSAPDVPGTGR